MSVLPLQHTKRWLKHHPHPLVRWLFAHLKQLRRWELPAPRLLTAPAYWGYCALRDGVATVLRLLWWTPMLRGRIRSAGPGLYLYGGLPFISGPVDIQLGNDCRISGQTTITGRAANRHQPPSLHVGDNVDIGWMTTLAVGKRILIGDNVRIAGRSLLAGYPGHPLDAGQRAAGLPDTDDQAGDIVLEADVWLATGVSVMAGVRIGRGTIVAAGSVVTRDLPPGVLAGGIPARPLRPLPLHPRPIAEGE